MRKINFFFILLITFSSCKKEEGVGGLGTIKGIVSQQNINCLLANSGSRNPAMDKDVYIQYGSNNYVNDKVETSPTGNFQFNYLTPGDYTIYIYSDDNENFKADNEIIISQNVTINGKKESVDLGEIIIYKHVDMNDGIIEVKGYVNKLIYAEGTTIVIDTIPAQDVDVFLLYEGSTSCFLKEKTLYDGSYSFRNLIPGDFSLYVLSEQPYTKEEIPIFNNFTLISGNTTQVLETIYISDY